jgi:hypothetical protein
VAPRPGGDFVAPGKMKKSGGDQKGQKPQTNTGSYGPVQKARVNALGESGLATTSPVDQPKRPSVQAKRSPDPLCPLKTTDVPLFLAHVSSVDDDNEGSDNFCKYLPIRINNYTCSALVDSGNIWRNAISKDFAFNHMKLTEADIRPLSTKTIGTAKDGAAMRVLGEVTQPLPLQLGGISTCLKTRPVVVEGLSMPFNLAGPFLKKHKIDQIHSEDCIRFQGHDVKLLKRRKGSYTDVEAALSNVYVVKKTVVKPMQHATVTLRAAEVEQKSMPAGDCVVTGSIKFMDTTNLHPWIDALTKVGEEVRLIAAVMNSMDKEITIQPGTCYVTISLTANGHQAWEEKPWRLCHIQAAASSHTLPEATVRVKLTPDGAPTDITERESDAIAAVSGATPKDNKESGRKPPLKDHETWPK